MGLDFALLTTEPRPQPEANILGQTRPHKPGQQKPPGSRNTRIRDLVKSKEQLVMENYWNQRIGRSGGHITEDGGSDKRNTDNGESRAGQHGLDAGEGRLKGRNGRKIKTGGIEIEWKSGENRQGGV